MHQCNMESARSQFFQLPQEIYVNIYDQIAREEHYSKTRCHTKVIATLGIDGKTVYGECDMREVCAMPGSNGTRAHYLSIMSGHSEQEEIQSDKSEDMLISLSAIHSGAECRDHEQSSSDWPENPNTSGLAHVEHGFHSLINRLKLCDKTRDLALRVDVNNNDWNPDGQSAEKAASQSAALKVLIKGIEEMPRVQRYSVQVGHHAMFASRKGDRNWQGKDVYRVTSAATRHRSSDEKYCMLLRGLNIGFWSCATVSAV
ncbi:hypothetical protein CERZMDRAFT_80418 [Cercospora zeae-maydis SCOH1-5]|uniref:Uncharacterized protein n=1 Tax=Cercospora zeae-maydis SCOH1-5 TaxID=717836 RepID=A0A6A6FW76_9PEZI|nr:hypothetical protein CERZMDRAFT_80418 [Cercospora zeae-maydis SCOH1-5]